MKKRVLPILGVVLVLSLLPMTVSSATEWTSYHLVAAQEHYAGWVSVRVVEDNLQVQFSTPPHLGCCLTETHVSVAQDVADIPQNKGGPIPGQFPYVREYPEPLCGDDEPYQIPLGDLDLEQGIVIAAHAQLTCEWSEDEETGWGGVCGTYWEFPNARKWAFYIKYPPAY